MTTNISRMCKHFGFILKVCCMQSEWASRSLARAKVDSGYLSSVLNS